MGLQENNYPPFPCLVCSSVCFELHVWHHLAHDVQKNQALTSCLWLWEWHHNHGKQIPECGHAATSVVRNTTGEQISVLGAFLCACWFTPTGLALYQDVKKSIRNVQIHARKQNNCAATFRHKELKREKVPVLCCLARSGKGGRIQDSVLRYSWEGWFSFSFPQFLHNFEEAKLSNCQRSQNPK